MENSFEYISVDLRDTDSNEQQQLPVCCGSIDYRRIFKHLFGVVLADDSLEQFRKVVDAAVKKANRCEVELLRAEFGSERTTMDQLVGATDTLFVNPMDANANKLNSVLEQIKGATLKSPILY